MALLLALAGGPALAQLPPAASGPAAAPLGAPRHLRVATGHAAPFVLAEGGALSGFSIDLWAALSQHLGASTSFINLGQRSDEAQLLAVERGEADVGLSAIVLTGPREQRVDFSIPFYDSGLQIMVSSDQGDAPVRTMLASLFSPTIGRLLLVGLGIVFLLANLLWLVERRENPRFRRGYVPGILEGIWGVVLIIATGEHGDRDAPGVVKRMTVAFMWLFGVVLIAQFTANVTSSLTVQRLQSNIQGPADLPGKAIATRPDSIAADYLRLRGLPFLPVSTAEEALAALTRGQVQAIVYEAPTLQYFAALRGGGTLQVVGPIFRPEKFGIAVAAGSPLRKEINAALLRMFADGSYEEIRRRWFNP